jgi:hypothetical protein
MVDPNRKINIDLQSDEESSSSSEDDVLNEEHVQLVKEFEEEFKDRFTEKDEEFMNFCKLKPKPPIIVYPFDNFFRQNNRGFNRNNYKHRGNHYQHQQNRNRNYNPQNRNNHYDRNSRDNRDNRDNRYGDAKRFRAD